jgi:hypothetical protein
VKGEKKVVGEILSGVASCILYVARRTESSETRLDLPKKYYSLVRAKPKIVKIELTITSCLLFVFKSAVREARM